MGRAVTDTSIAKVLAGPKTDFLPPPGVQYLSNGVLDQFPIAIATFDCDGRLARYNRSAADLWGRPPHVGDAISPLDRIAKDVVRTRAPLRGREVVFERPDGRRVFTSANADLLFGEDGDLAGVMICLTDITALTSKQQDGRADRAPVCSTRFRSRFTRPTRKAGSPIYNQAAADFWGRRPELHREQWCGALKLFHPGGIPLPHEDCPMAVSLKYGMALRGTEAIAERPDGTRIPFARSPHRFATARAA